MATRRCRLAAATAATAALAAVMLAASTGATPPSTGAVASPTAASASVAASLPPPLVRRAAAPPVGLHFLVDGELRPTLEPRPLVHSFGSATDALTVLFVPTVAGEAVTATRVTGLDASVCTHAAAAVAPLATASSDGGGPAAGAPAGASNVTLTMEFDGGVGKTDFTVSVDTVDSGGEARTYSCAGSYVVCGLSLHDAATGAVVSGDGGVGVSLGSYADVLAADTVRVAVKAQVCGSGGGDVTPSLDGVAVTFRDVDADADADLGVFPQPDRCAAVADRLADGCSHCFTPDGAALLLRPAAYRVGSGAVAASLVWPAAAVDGEAWETDVAIRIDTTPPPPPVVGGLAAADADTPLDVYGGELVTLTAFNAPVYGGRVGGCTWSVAGRSADLVRDACTFGPADQALVFQTAGGPAFSAHNDSVVTCDGVAAVASARPWAVAFGDGRLARAGVANGTAFVATATAARAAAVAVSLRFDVYTPATLSATKVDAVAARLAAAAGVPADHVACVDVTAAASAAGGGASTAGRAVATLYVQTDVGEADAAGAAMADAVTTGALARAVRLAPDGVALESVGAAPGTLDGAGAQALGGLSTVAAGLVAGSVVVALTVLVLAAAAVRSRAASMAAESDLSSSSGPLGVPAAALGGAGEAPILRDAYGRSEGGVADTGVVAAAVAAAAGGGGEGGSFASGRSDASSTYSM